MMDIFEYIEHNKIPLDIRYVKIFWEPAFNDGWIYLDRLLIKDWFCRDDKSEWCIKNFYNSLLLKNYIKNEDYKELEHDNILLKKDYYKSLWNVNRKTPPVKHNTKFYAVSPDCFKMICVERNKSILRYFIDIEKLFHKYIKYQCEYYKKNYEDQLQKIMENKDNKKYTQILKLKDLDDSLNNRYRIGCIYYIRCGEFIKIGYTYNLRKRLMTLQSSNPIKLIVVHTILTDYCEDYEKREHEKYLKYRVRGEWFKLPDETIKCNEKNY